VTDIGKRTVCEIISFKVPQSVCSLGSENDNGGIQNKRTTASPEIFAIMKMNEINTLKASLWKMKHETP
jgi:hypothetical protein